MRINLLRSSHLIVYFLSFAYISYVRCTDIDVVQTYTIEQVFIQIRICSTVFLFVQEFIRIKI